MVDVWIDVSKIRYNQLSIYYHFRDQRSVFETVVELLLESVSLSDIPILVREVYDPARGTYYVSANNPVDSSHSKHIAGLCSKYVEADSLSRRGEG
jgi:hypothetical protein